MRKCGVLGSMKAGRMGSLWHYGTVAPMGLLPLSTLIEGSLVRFEEENCE